MKYLLDVNALVALGFAEHEMHAQIATWLQTEGFPGLATCSITELGFVRVLAQVPPLWHDGRTGESSAASTEEESSPVAGVLYRWA